MDLNMPGISGVEATRQISMIAPLTRVLVLTISDQDEDVMDAVLAGACGYLLKDASISVLMQGIRSAAVGESLISPTIAAKVLQRVRATGGSRREAELMLKKAARHAERMEEEVARRGAARLSELARLEALKEDVVARLRGMLEAMADRHADGANSGKKSKDAVAPARTKR